MWDVTLASPSEGEEPKIPSQSGREGFRVGKAKGTECSGRYDLHIKVCTCDRKERRCTLLGAEIPSKIN